MNECLMIVCSVLLIGFMDKDQDKQTTDMVGWGFIGIICLVLAINWLTIVPMEIYNILMKIVSTTALNTLNH